MDGPAGTGVAGLRVRGGPGDLGAAEQLEELVEGVGGQVRGDR
jgi:hypothetical protein